jgi:hypothetical protein
MPDTPNYRVRDAKVNPEVVSVYAHNIWLSLNPANDNAAIEVLLKLPPAEQRRVFFAARTAGYSSVNAAFGRPPRLRAVGAAVAPVYAFYIEEELRYAEKDVLAVAKGKRDLQDAVEGGLAEIRVAKEPSAVAFGAFMLSGLAQLSNDGGAIKKDYLKVCAAKGATVPMDFEDLWQRGLDYFEFEWEAAPGLGYLPEGIHIDTGKELIPPDYLVDDMIPLTGTGSLIGQSGAGKSFLAIDLALAVVTGQPFFGKEIEEPCAAIYCAFEGGGQIKYRMRAAMLHRGAQGRVPLAWTDKAFNLSDDEEREAFIAQLKEIQSFLCSSGIRLGLIVIDTLVMAFEVEDENDAAELIAIYKKIQYEIADKFECFVLAVVHAGKDQSKGARGTSAHRGQPDICLFASGDRNEAKGTCENRALAQSKNRDGYEGPISGYDLAEYEICKDKRGRPKTSVAIKPTGEVRAEKPKKAPLAKYKYRPQFTQAFEAAIIDHGVERRLSATAGVGTPIMRCVEVRHVKAEFYKLCVGLPKSTRTKAWQSTLAALFREYPQETDAGVEWIWKVPK